ncbi:MAG: Wzz/FepE/Etk N-terminal domain-containing protein [Bacteroidota bacterium]
MALQTERRPRVHDRPEYGESLDLPLAPDSASAWHALGVLWGHRRFLVAAVVLAAVSSVVVSLLLPKWYEGSTRVLLPSSPLGGGLTSLIGDLSPIASSLIGGGSGDYSRYLAILTSDRVVSNTIEEFDLIRVYENEGKTYANYLTAREFGQRVDFVVDLEYEFLSVNVLDRSPERAAAMANFLVAQLNEINSELETEDAARYRSFIENRYDEAVAEMDSLRNSMQEFQEETGMIELPTMAEAFLESFAAQRAEAIRSEIEYEALRQQYGADNPQVVAAQEIVAASRRKEAALLGGADRIMPVAMDDLPAAANEYARIYQDLLIQAKILEVTRPLYEQARFQEERSKVAVQVLDQAYPPERKAKPKRALVVIAMTFSVFLLAVCFLLVRDWVRRHGDHIQRRIQAAS